jgi:hypothetical protein
VKPFENLPVSFWCLMKKGEKDRLKLEGSTPCFLGSALSGKTGLSGLALQNFSYLFTSCFSGLEKYL